VEEIDQPHVSAVFIHRRCYWSVCRVGRSFLCRGSLGRGNGSLNNNYFAEQHSATGVCVGEEMSSTWGVDSVTWERVASV
jgi:hypothetical protein